ncbi:MAG: hypothetical protein AB7E84_00250 [Xanthobacteraceae bacterium]
MSAELFVLLVILAVVEDAAHRLPADQRREFLDRVAVLLASHAETPSREQVRLAVRLAAVVD